MVDPEGRPSETQFRAVASVGSKHLIEARPYSGRQHQIRVHLAESLAPILGDELYGGGEGELALRAVGLAFRDPFTRKPVTIRAPVETFLRSHGFPAESYRVEFATIPRGEGPATRPERSESQGTRNPKSDGRGPKEIRKPNDEARKKFE